MKLWLTWLFRLALGGIFLVSGIAKVADADSFAQTLRGLDLLQSFLIPPIVLFLPIVEIVFGLMLVVGFYIRRVSYAILGLLALFTTVILVQILKGNAIACNCFGPIWDSQTDITALLRNFSLAGITILVARQQYHSLTLDNFFRRLKRNSYTSFFAHNRLEIVSALAVIVLLTLSITLAQRIRSQDREVPESRHSHKHFVFQAYGVSQQDSVMDVYYENRKLFHREVWSGIPIYLETNTIPGSGGRIVAFIEEDVGCSTCRDVRFLVELRGGNEIVEISFIEPFESYLGQVSTKRMDKFKKQFL
ncbi:DoxX family membrane protein, partial [bacterium]|nr:DoxX family membrane protein [bacterium]